MHLPILSVVQAQLIKNAQSHWLSGFPGKNENIFFIQQFFDPLLIFGHPGKIIIYSTRYQDQSGN